MIVSQSINLTGFAIFSWTWIYEINDANNFSKDSKEIFSIDIDISSITKYIDPVYQFYLDNSYLLNKDKFYFIILTN
jgi:hypothetical protein